MTKLNCEKVRSDKEPSRPRFLNCGGQAMVEFGIIAPIFFAAVFGTVGLMLMCYQVTAEYQAVQDGLRAAEASYKYIKDTADDVETVVMQGLGKRGIGQLPTTVKAQKKWPAADAPYVIEVRQKNMGSLLYFKELTRTGANGGVFLNSDWLLPKEKK